MVHALARLQLLPAALEPAWPMTERDASFSLRVVGVYSGALETHTPRPEAPWRPSGVEPLTSSEGIGSGSGRTRGLCVSRGSVRHSTAEGLAPD